MQRIIMGILLLGLAWAIGLAAFIAGLPKPTLAPPAQTDGVIVYTGGGGARIKAAMTVFASGAGERMLISGVHPSTSRERLFALWEGAPDLFECCVDLGHEARSTTGNAVEAAKWAHNHGFHGVIIVTSDYHMPRALLETKEQLRDMEISSYVVASGYLDDKGRPLSRQAWRKLAGEYTKYLLARVKAFFSVFSV